LIGWGAVEFLVSFLFSSLSFFPASVSVSISVYVFSVFLSQNPRTRRLHPINIHHKHTFSSLTQHLFPGRFHSPPRFLLCLPDRLVRAEYITSLTLPAVVSGRACAINVKMLVRTGSHYHFYTMHCMNVLLFYLLFCLPSTLLLSYYAYY